MIQLPPRSTRTDPRFPCTTLLRSPAPRFEAAGLDLHLACKAVARKRGDDMDHARGRVAAIERSLRTAQHLDTLEVEEFGFEQAVADERGVVEADRDRGVVRRGNRLGPDAANGEVIAAEIALREIDVGHRAHQLDRKSTRLNSSH